MAQGNLTPLQITAAAGLLNNTGLKSVPSSITTNVAAFDATSLIALWLSALSYYKAQSFKTTSTLDSFLSMGSTTCPALGNSIPAAPVGTYTNLINEYLPGNNDQSALDSSGLADLVEQTAAAYLGNGDIGRFCQGFMAIQGYISTTNQFINAAQNSTTYLGPTFDGMDNLVTNSIAQINTDLPAFAADLRNQGKLTNFNNLNQYGTPAALLQQITAVAGGLTLAVNAALLGTGLTTTDIKNLTTNNVQSLLNPRGLTPVEFDMLQQQAYQGFGDIRDADLDEVLSILEISTPNLVSLADLLDPIKVFPNSYATMQTPTTYGTVPVYLGNTISPGLDSAVNASLPSASGCDQLGKIIPPAQATANKAIQVALQNISNIANSSPEALATAIDGSVRKPWNINDTYLANDIVAAANTIAATPDLATLAPTTVFYQAQDDVPAGTDITDTNYWLPTTLGGVNTMTGLPLIEAQTTPVSSSATNYFSNSIATGTGPNGTITTCDVLGTAVDHANLAAQLAAATSAINSLDGLGALNTLKTTYTNMASAASDSAMIGYISTANSDISSIASNPAYTTYVTALNTAWNTIAASLNKERGYQVQAAVDYFNLQSGEKVSTYGFSQSLQQYGESLDCCGPRTFITSIADTTTSTGQAIVGSLREGENKARLAEAQLQQNYNPSTEPEVAPVPCVTPVN